MEEIHQWKSQLVVPGDDRSVLFFRAMIEMHIAGRHPLQPNTLDPLRLSFDSQMEVRSDTGRDPVLLG